MKIETERLLLREWRDEDIAPLASVLSNPMVRRFYPNALSAEQTAELVARFRDDERQHGFCFLAAEIKDTRQLIGLIGIARIPHDLTETIPGSPDVEIGWQIDQAIWGQGLAPEGAMACLDYAWRTLKLAEVVSFTFEGNMPSRRVMEKIGMKRDKHGDFAHPRLTPESPLSRHALYRIANPLL